MLGLKSKTDSSSVAELVLPLDLETNIILIG